MPRIGWFPELGVWPSYGLILHLPHLAHFALALGAEAVQNALVLKALAWLIGAFIALDVYAGVVLVSWVVFYYMGTLDATLRAGIPVWQMLILALSSIVFIVLSVLNLMRIVSAIGAVRLYRIYYGLEEPDAPDGTEEDEGETTADDDATEDEEDEEEEEDEGGEPVPSKRVELEEASSLKPIYKR